MAPHIRPSLGTRVRWWLDDHLTPRRVLVAAVLCFLLGAVCAARAGAQTPAEPPVKITAVDTVERMMLHRVNWDRQGDAERQRVAYGVGLFADSVGVGKRDTTRAFFLPVSRESGWVCVVVLLAGAEHRHCRAVPPTLAGAPDPVEPAPPADTTPAEPTPEPEPPAEEPKTPDAPSDPGAVAPFFSIRWDTLTTDRWRGNAVPKYAPASQTIDASAPAAPGAVASLRWDYAAKSATDPDRCNDHSVGFTPIGDGAPVAFPSGTKEVWTELWVRWEPGYDTRPPAEWNCGRAADQKIWRLYPKLPSGARNTYHSLNVGNQGGAFLLFRPAGDPVDGTAASNVRGPDVWTGQWIRFRMHDRLSCSQAKTGKSTIDVAWFDASGRLVKETRLWADGVGYIQHGPEGPGVPYDGTAVATYDRASGVPYCVYDYLRIGMNRNLHPPRAMKMWVGPVRVYLQNPGWKE